MPFSQSGSGGGSGTLLFSSVLSSPATSIDSGASTFSTTFSVLTIYIVARTNDAGTGAGAALVTFNNDSGTNYNQQNLSGNNASAAASQNLARANFGFNVNSAGDTSNDFSIICMSVPLYGSTTINKSATAQHFQASATTALLVEAVRGCVWGSTAAINRVAMSTGSSSTFNTGSGLLIYAA